MLTVDDTTATSLYLSDDTVADQINTLYASNKIQVSGQALPFPRPTGDPELLHGDGSPEGMIYAGQGSLYLRRDNASMYQKTSGIHLNTNWNVISGPTLQVVTAGSALPASPVNGQQAMVRAGSSPYAFVPLVYDSTYGHWVSPELPLGGTAPYIDTGNNTGPQLTTQGVGFGASFSGVSWQPAYSGGLTLQLRWAGVIYGTGNHLLADAGIYLEWFSDGGASTTATMLERQGYQDTTTYICTDFANVTAAGGYDMLNAGIYVRADSNNAGNGMIINNAGIVGRWVY
jgi:hypothetical protein